MLYHAIPWFLVLAVPVAAVTLVIARRLHRDLPARERRWQLLLEVALALCLLGIACVTLLPTVGGGTGLEQGLQLRPVASIIAQLTSALDASVAFRIVGLNIVLFVPLGFLLRVRPLGWLATVAVVVATSLTIETAQAVLPLGRTANVDDVLLNTLGGVLGAASGSLLLRRRGRPQPVEVARRPDA
jgi:glycopeptide antibiotics resistance protein